MRALKELIHGASPNIIFLSETKIKTPKVRNICDRLKFVDSWCIDSVGISSGFALFWRMGVDLEVVFSDKNMIVALVYSDPLEAPWLLFASMVCISGLKRGIFGFCLKAWWLPSQAPRL